MFYFITNFRYSMTAIKIRDDILNIPSKYRKDIRSNRNLSVDLKRIRELGSKRNLNLSTLLSFGLIYTEIYT